MRAMLLILVLAVALAAQETRHETVNAAKNPADDAKGLSDKVPDVYAVATQLEKWFESLRVRTPAAHRDGSVLAGRAVAETADGQLDEPRRRAG